MGAIPQQPKPVISAEESSYVPQPMSLSKNGGDLTIGKAKSGKSWNEKSNRSGKHQRYNPKTWEKKMQERK